jgi:glycosyltransferase involved in cell wall biosynthesis
MNLKVPEIVDGMGGLSSSTMAAQVMLSPLTQPYLLVTCIPCYRDRQGQRFIDALWHKDLIQHLDYIKDFTLAAPCIWAEPPAGYVALDQDPRFAAVQYVDLPAPQSFLQALKSLPATLAAVWTASERAAIVHTGVAGYPLPPGWLVTPIILLRRKFYLVIVESAFWRLTPGMVEPWSRRLRAKFSEGINRWCINQADLSLFTQEQYMTSLLTRQTHRGRVIHASWIDADALIDHVTLAEVNQQKATQSFKVLFAGRLIREKGIPVLLESARMLATPVSAGHDSPPTIHIDIMGQGELEALCQEASHQLSGRVQVNCVPSLPYGLPFFHHLRKYDAVVVPSMSDEQPRLVYDAYSQGVPVIASATTGLKDCVRHQETGLLVPPNQPSALAETLTWAAQHREALTQMGLQGRSQAQGLTHQEMHRQRWQLLQAQGLF